VKRNLVVTILFVSAAFAFFTFAAYQSEGQEQEAKSQRVENEEQEAKYRRAKEPIPNRYIVVLEDWSTGGRGEASRAADVANEMRSIYGGKSSGFSNTRSAVLPPNSTPERLRL
jgi:hypothetical protein